jgi:hypothetical protein
MRDIWADMPSNLAESIPAGIVEVIHRDKGMLTDFAASRQLCEKVWLQRAIPRYFSGVEHIHTKTEVRMSQEFLVRS